MTAKKRFLNSCEHLSNALDISWSSSTPEKTTPITKKFKSNEDSSKSNPLINAWINMGQSPRKSYSSTLDDNSLNICSQFTCSTTCLEDVKPAISGNGSFEESPIIGSLKLGEISPILGFTPRDSIRKLKPSPVIGSQRTSPVIGKRYSNVRKIVKDETEQFRPKLLRINSTEQIDTLIKSNLYQSSQVLNKKKVYSKFRKQSQQLKPRSHSTQQSDTVIETISPRFPEVSLPQSDPIIECNSPSASQKTTLSISSDQSYHNNSDYTIDPFLTQESEVAPNTDLIETPISQELLFNARPSQTSKIKTLLDSIIDTSSTSASTEIKTIIETTESSSTKSSNVEPLYHEVPPKKKKKYKKEGLADQLQKALHKQKTDFAIWRHELYLRKTKGEAASLTDECSVLMLKINKFWKEFAVTIVECEKIKDHEDTVRSKNSASSGVQAENQNLVEIRRLDDNDSINKSKKCLVVIGYNITHCLRIKINAKFKLCMPYNTKLVKHNGESLICYFNVSKLLSFK